MKTTKTALVKTYMSKYGITESEALEMIAYDEETDRMTIGEIKATLTKEQNEAIKEATKTTSGEPKKRTAPKREKDAEKVEIVEKIADFLGNFTDLCEITNAGQEISFTIGENHYGLKLSKHRTPKK